MQVHRQFYKLNRYPWEYQDEDLITLCIWCHAEFHQNNSVNRNNDKVKNKAAFSYDFKILVFAITGIKFLFPETLLTQDIIKTLHSTSYKQAPGLAIILLIFKSV